MKRPQSAKHGQQGGWGHVSSDVASDQQNNELPYPQHRKKVKIMKPDFTTNDFARILPKKIYQDKQRLYSQALQLKQHLNETFQQNTRLKTKIAILEKQKQKMNRFIQSSEIALTKGGSRLNIYSTKQPQKQNTMMRNLKKIVRQGKDQNQSLKQENIKIKKAIKYTKINELQIQRKMLLEENQKISSLLLQLNDRIDEQGQLQKQLQQLKKYLEQQVENNKQLTEANQNYVQYIQSLEDKIKKDEEKVKDKYQKLHRQLALHKRKLNEEIKHSDQLRKQIKALRQQSINQKKKIVQQKVNRPTTSNPYIKKNNQNSSISEISHQKQFNELKQKNNNLENQLKQIKDKLKTSQNQMRKIETKLGQQNKVADKKLRSKSQLRQNKQFVSFIAKDEKNIQIQYNKQEKYAQNQNYEDQFEQQPDLKKKQNTQISQIQEHKQRFNEENDQQQQIYRKQEEKPKNHLDKKSKDKTKHNKEKNYRPSKKTMMVIKQLLTYRMKAQRYPFDELKNDIQVSGERQFKYEDLINMFKTQPFYLTNDFAENLLKYIYQSQNPLRSSKVGAQELIKKLRKCFEDFQIIQEQQQQQMLLRIAEMTSTYPNQLEAAFEKVKNGQGTISRSNLIQMFQKLQLAHNYIELIIAELSLCSEDLEHLNYHGFFQRFYINEGDKQFESNQAIDEEQIQSSGGSSKPLQNLKKPQIDEFDDPQFAEQNNQEIQLSMGMKNNEPYNGDQEILSNDDKI